MRIMFALLAASAVAAPALAEGPQGGSGLRSFTTDRPDRTDNPYTVPRGRVQIEGDFLRYGRTKEDFQTLNSSFVLSPAKLELETFEALPFNLRIGVGQNTEVQIAWSPIVKLRTELKVQGDPTTDFEADGTGDVQLRLKQNLLGNDGGQYAFALLPSVTLPLRDDEIGSKNIQFGLAAPFAVSLSERLGLGLQAAVESYESPVDEEREALYSLSASLGYGFNKYWGGFVELEGTAVSDDAGGETATAGAGLAWRPTPSLQFDLSAFFGLNDRTPDLDIGIGLAKRF